MLSGLGCDDRAGWCCQGWDVMTGLGCDVRAGMC